MTEKTAITQTAFVLMRMNRLFLKRINGASYGKRIKWRTVGQSLSWKFFHNDLQGTFRASVDNFLRALGMRVQGSVSLQHIALPPEHISALVMVDCS